MIFALIRILGSRLHRKNRMSVHKTGLNGLLGAGATYIQIDSVWSVPRNIEIVAIGRTAGDHHGLEWFAGACNTPARHTCTDRVALTSASVMRAQLV